jgi:hypothetical protein
VQLGVQVLGAAAIGFATLALNTIGFGLLRWLGCLRVPKQVRRLRASRTCTVFLPSPCTLCFLPQLIGFEGPPMLCPVAPRLSVLCKDEWWTMRRMPTPTV